MANKARKTRRSLPTYDHPTFRPRLWTQAEREAAVEACRVSAKAIAEAHALAMGYIAGPPDDEDEVEAERDR